MPWRKPLPEPIILTDGRVLEQLRDVREVLIEPPVFKDPAVQQALQLMLEAAETDHAANLQAAIDQVTFVLRHHKLLDSDSAGCRSLARGVAKPEERL
jgi:hypothetical protein